MSGAGITCGGITSLYTFPAGAMILYSNPGVHFVFYLGGLVPIGIQTTSQLSGWKEMNCI